MMNRLQGMRVGREGAGTGSWETYQEDVRIYPDKRCQDWNQGFFLPYCWMVRAPELPRHVELDVRSEGGQSKSIQ